VIVFPNNTLEKLEFHDVCDILAAYCNGAAGKLRAKSLKPSSDVAEVSRWISEVFELTEIRGNKLSFPDYHFVECSKELSFLALPGAVLDGAQCNLIRDLVETTSGLIRGVRLLEPYPSLRNLVIHSAPDTAIAQMIDSIVEPNGFIRSSASKTLADIRKNQDEVRKRSNRVFESMLKKYQKLGWLREYGESYYHDRRVLATIAEHKNKIDGIIHGSSESGSTTFVEPESMVPLNNQMVDLKQREEQELRRILKQLTASIAKHLPLLKQYFDILVTFDFLEAKTKFAIELGAKAPHIDGRCNELSLIGAVHPLLLRQNKKQKITTIPLDLKLDTENSILVISGPNAGGKSIALKTVGLLQIMLQSGLLVPVHETSVMPVFSQLLIDIGDDQSIEYQLSTYSSRLKKLKHFMRVADSRTLLLLDEFGTGSDPELGGAIAEAILIELLKFKPWGIITTHFSNIKIAAENLSGLINGSMLFNEQTLEPEYKLSIGSPGSSYTFEVAKKIGLDPAVLKLARTKVDQRKVRLDKLLVELQSRKKQLEVEQQQLQKERKETIDELERLEKEMEKIRLFQESLNKEEHMRLIESGKKYDSLMEFWVKTKNKKELTRKLVQAAEKIEQKQKMKAVVEIQSKTSKRKKKQKPVDEPWKQIGVGDKVRMKDGKSSGEVEQISGAKASVLFGNMKISVATNQLILLMKKK
jgi:DNA mismatch repair protein MutS2